MIGLTQDCIVRTMAKILSSNDGRTIMLEAELCTEILDHMSSNSPLSISDGCSQIQSSNVQGLAEHKLHSSEKPRFFDTLWTLAGKHARLPNSMIRSASISPSFARGSPSPDFRKSSVLIISLSPVSLRSNPTRPLSSRFARR